MPSLGKQSTMPANETITVRGQPVPVKSITVGSTIIVATGSLLTVAAVKDEAHQ